MRSALLSLAPLRRSSDSRTANYCSVKNNPSCSRVCLFTRAINAARWLGVVTCIGHPVPDAIIACEMHPLRRAPFHNTVIPYLARWVKRALLTVLPLDERAVNKRTVLAKRAVGTKRHTLKQDVIAKGCMRTLYSATNNLSKCHE